MPSNKEYNFMKKTAYLLADHLKKAVALYGITDEEFLGDMTAMLSRLDSTMAQPAEDNERLGSIPPSWRPSARRITAGEETVEDLCRSHGLRVRDYSLAGQRDIAIRTLITQDGMTIGRAHGVMADIMAAQQRAQRPEVDRSDTAVAARLEAAARRAQPIFDENNRIQWTSTTGDMLFGRMSEGTVVSDAGNSTI